MLNLRCKFAVLSEEVRKSGKAVEAKVYPAFGSGPGKGTVSVGVARRLGVRTFLDLLNGHPESRKHRVLTELSPLFRDSKLCGVTLHIRRSRENGGFEDAAGGKTPRLLTDPANLFASSLAIAVLPRLPYDYCASVEVRVWLFILAGMRDDK